MKFKVMAGGISKFRCGVGAGDELPKRPAHCPPGTASVDAVPDVATTAIEVNGVAAKMLLPPRNRQTIVLRNTSLSRNRTVSRKDISSANLRT